MGLFDIFSDKNEKAAARAQKRGLERGRAGAFEQIDAGQAGYDEFAGRAYDEFDTYDDLGRGSATMYSDALGIGGDEGTARARAAYETSPGYDFEVEEALRAIERSGAARGGTDSGGLIDALRSRAQDYARTDFSGWLDRLSGNVDRGINVAGARSDILSGQGTQRYNTGMTKANIDWNTETGKGSADAAFQMAKENSGMNIFDALMGGLKLAAGA